MYPHDLNAPVNPWTPEPPGVCDRCYRLFYLRDLTNQWDYNGPKLANRHIRVCPTCLDEPCDQNRPPAIRGREGWVKDPRPPQYEQNAQGGPYGPVYPSGTDRPPPLPNPVDD